MELTVSGLHAQTKPPLFLITEIDVTNPEAYGKEFAPKAQPTIKAAGARFLLIGGTAGAGAKPITAIAGTRPKRVTVQVWDSLEAMNKWYNGADYQAALDPPTDLDLDDAVIVEGERDEAYASGRARASTATRCYTVREMSDDAPKSAFELAMQRLRQKDNDTDVDARPLTDAQKAAIAEVRQVFTAKSAEGEILHQAALRKAATRQEVELLKENLRRDVERLVSDRDRKIGEIRGEASP